jgi:hypothetical protein
VGVVHLEIETLGGPTTGCVGHPADGVPATGHLDEVLRGSVHHPFELSPQHPAAQADAGSHLPPAHQLGALGEFGPSPQVDRAGIDRVDPVERLLQLGPRPIGAHSLLAEFLGRNPGLLGNRREHREIGFDIGDAIGDERNQLTLDLVALTDRPITGVESGAFVRLRHGQ